MFRHLMNGSSLLALALRDADNENGNPDPKTVLREQLSKGNVQKEGINEQDTNEENEEGEEDGGEDEENEEEENNEEDEEEEVKNPPEDETEEQKKVRETKEKEEAKAQRKQDRMQRRIDKAIAAKNNAEAEVARLKAQLEANPDQKLTAEEVEAKAEAIAAKKLADKELADVQSKFNSDCDKLQKAATKIDKEFDTKINELAEDIGPIPSFMIGVLSDMDNGGEVLAHIANDDELAEEIWGAKPAKMTRLLVDISTKLAEKAKPPRKQISKVPDPITPVKTNRVVSNVITEADTKNMDNYVAKRQRQMLEKRKLQGFN